jgi:hypothetical protein
MMGNSNSSQNKISFRQSRISAEFLSSEDAFNQNSNSRQSISDIE